SAVAVDPWARPLQPLCPHDPPGVGGDVRLLAGGRGVVAEVRAVTGSENREPPECTDDIYPGLSVWEERVSGSLTIKNSRLPLWAFVWTAITKGWEEANSGWGLSSYGYTADDLGQVLYYLFDLRAELARLLADAAPVR